MYDSGVYQERDKLRKENRLLRQMCKEALYMRFAFLKGLTFQDWIQTREYRLIWNQAKRNASTATGAKQ